MTPPAALRLLGFGAVAGLALLALLGFDLLAVVTVVVPLALLAVGFMLVRMLLTRIRWRRPVRFREEPIPDAWRTIVATNVPLVERLSDDERQRLLRLVQVFLHEKRVEGAGGLQITEEMAVTIAAQACLLLLNLAAGCYPGLRTVLVYPGTFVPTRPRLGAPGRPDGPSEPTLGESWRGGVVVLSWPSVSAGGRNLADGQNLVLHEFAHQLDQEDGEADGIPLLDPPSAIRSWAEVLGRHYDALRSARDRGAPSVLDHYGAENKAEFFAVATEAFFAKPVQLARQAPDLYAELSRFYRQDPAAWGAGEQPASDDGDPMSGA